MTDMSKRPRTPRAFKPTMRHAPIGACFQALVAAGLSIEDSAAWAQVTAPGPMTGLAEHARAWQAAGFDTVTALAWNRYGLLSPEAAKRWIAAGYTPGTAWFVMLDIGTSHI